MPDCPHHRMRPRPRGHRMKLSRRGFLRGATATAIVAASPLPSFSMRRVFENEVLHLYEPLRLSSGDILIIKRCELILHWEPEAGHVDLMQIPEIPDDDPGAFLYVGGCLISFAEHLNTPHYHAGKAAWLAEREAPLDTSMLSSHWEKLRTDLA